MVKSVTQFDGETVVCFVLPFADRHIIVSKKSTQIFCLVAKCRSLRSIGTVFVHLLDAQICTTS